jgi:hypothetical protein
VSLWEIYAHRPEATLASGASAGVSLREIKNLWIFFIPERMSELQTNVLTQPEPGGIVAFNEEAIA